MICCNLLDFRIHWLVYYDYDYLFFFFFFELKQEKWYLFYTMMNVKIFLCCETITIKIVLIMQSAVISRQWLTTFFIWHYSFLLLFTVYQNIIWITRYFFPKKLTVCPMHFLFLFFSIQQIQYCTYLLTNIFVVLFNWFERFEFFHKDFDFWIVF